MPSFYDDNDDLRWYVEQGIDWEPLVRWTEYDFQAPDHFPDVASAVVFYKEALALVGQYAAESIAPRWRELDAAHPTLEDGAVREAPVVREVMAGLGALGVHGLCLPRELGGMNCPYLLLQLNNEMIARADVSICTHVSFHGGIALATLLYSVLEGTTTFSTDPVRIIDTRFRDCIEEIAGGTAWGSMDITEPHAGSDMAALRCRGAQDADGNWTVNGQKIFITSGHGRWHLVIARTAPGEGLDGLSMFLVPAWTDGPEGRVRHVTVLGLEEKLGHNASATCTVAFDHAPARLIGKPGEGFKYMLMLMNNARVGVGFEALGLMEAALRAARAFAAERTSMGKLLEQHELVAEMLDEMEADIIATRAMAMAAGTHEELSQKLRLALLHFPMDEARRTELDALQRRHTRRSRQLTPLLKWFAAERAVEAARRAIQIHGGMGYIRETGVEKLLRDAMVLPIYEGTSQIQALMAMKDALMSVIKDPGRFLKRGAGLRWSATTAADPLERRVAGLRLVAWNAVQHLISRLAAAKLGVMRYVNPSGWAAAFKDWDPKRDFALALLHAERLTGLLTDAAVAGLLHDQVARDPARQPLLERWLELAEPRAKFRYEQITRTGTRLLGKIAAGAPTQGGPK